MPLSSSWKKLIFGNDVLALPYTILRATIHFDYAIFYMIIVWFRRFKELRRIILMLKILLTELRTVDGRGRLSIVEVYNTRCTWPLADSCRHEIGRRCNRSDGFNFFVFSFLPISRTHFFYLSIRIECSNEVPQHPIQSTHWLSLFNKANGFFRICMTVRSMQLMQTNCIITSMCCN